MTFVPSSFADLILHHAKVRPERPAVVLADRVVTYDMVAQGILRAADRIRALELPPHALVGIAIESPIRHMILASALYRLGHPTLSVDKIADVLPLGLPVAAFLHGANTTIYPGARQHFVGDDWFEGERRPIECGGTSPFDDANAICRVELSSGTTGRPKAVSLSVGALHQWLVNYFAVIGLGFWDRLLCLPGLTGSWGFSLAAHVLFAGRTLLFAPTARESLQMVALYGVDAMAASTQQLRDMIGEQNRDPIPCPSLRVVLTGGSLVAPTLMRDTGAKICNQIVNLYGSTEAGATAFATTDRLVGVDGATGYIAPWAKVEVVDEDDHLLPPDTEGILRIRASCQGAAFPPDRPDGHAGFRGGGFYPGDRGRITNERLLILTGRTSEVINMGGVKLAPALIEYTLLQHPAVAEAAALGRLGKDGVEEIVLILVARHPFNTPSMINWCAERGITVAEIIMVDALPKTTSGKLQREALRRQYAP